MKLTKRQLDVLETLYRCESARIFQRTSSSLGYRGYGLFMTEYGKGERVPKRTAEALINRGYLWYYGFENGWRITFSGRKALREQRRI